MRKSSKGSQAAADNLMQEIFPVATRVATSGKRNRQSVRRDDLEPWELNPRKRRPGNKLAELGESLKSGQINPLIVRLHPDEDKRELGVFQIIAGVSRWMAGAPQFGDIAIYDVDVRNLDDDKEALDLAFAENDKGIGAMTALENARYFQVRRSMEGGGEESLRSLAQKTEYGRERIRQLENLLELPKFILSEFENLELNEKHGRALLSLNAFPDEQRKLFREIERAAASSEESDRISGNAALKRAKTALAELQKEADDEKAASQKNVEKYSGAQKGNADDDDFKANDDQLASRDHETRGQKAGGGGVGSSAPVSSGSGFATASNDGQNLKPAPAAKEKTIFASDIAEELETFAGRLGDLEARLKETAPDPFFVTRILNSLTKIALRAYDFQDAIKDKESEPDQKSAKTA